MSDWKLKGHYFEACSCDVVCPCIFLKDPSKGICEGYLVWRIDQGEKDGVDLGGLTVAAALHAPGNLTAGGMKFVIYIDKRASEEQIAALTSIYKGEVGGHPAVIAGLVGEIAAIIPAEIQVKCEDNEKTLSIDGVGGIQMTALTGGDDSKPVTVNNNPLAVSPGQPTTIHDVQNVDHKGYGMDWQYSGTGGLSAPFEYAP